MPPNSKNEYARSVAFFLSELIRTRKTSLRRAADIASRVVIHLNLIDTEQDFLRLIKELTADFEELNKLQERIYISIKVDERKDLEKKVREFAVTTILSDVSLASQILQAASLEDVRINDLFEKFPQFYEWSRKF